MSSANDTPTPSSMDAFAAVLAAHDRELTLLHEAFPALKESLAREFSQHLQNFSAIHLHNFSAGERGRNDAALRDMFDRSRAEVIASSAAAALEKLKEFAATLEQTRQGVGQTAEQVAQARTALGARVGEFIAEASRQMETALAAKASEMSARLSAEVQQESEKTRRELAREFHEKYQAEVGKLREFAAQVARESKPGDPSAPLAPTTINLVDLYRGQWNAKLALKKGELCTFRGCVLLALRDVPAGLVPSRRTQTGPNAYHALFVPAGAPGASAQSAGGASGPITSSGLTQNTGKLLGRTTASSGPIEEIGAGDGLSLAAGTLSVATAQTTITSVTSPGALTLATTGNANLTVNTGSGKTLIDLIDIAAGGSGFRFASGQMTGFSGAHIDLASNARLGWGNISLTETDANGAQVNNGTPGTFRDLKLRNLIPSGGSGLGSFTVATLPATAGAGLFESAGAWVTDSNTAWTAGIGAVVVGGGANKVPVRYDGTNWRIG